ncbi:alpha/beta fold hydrolase [Parahaliea mediterranea]|uniref:alpha/beta fold hydrolase n=1 Tax=Parahaliea mediterranea TaxID=651086 RepID=UPI000E2EA9E1|nr:alpha/beta fold hydrolase [Parahaliea mediterranea]
MPHLQANGATLYYEEHGLGADAPALVLAHGMGGNHAIWFRQLTDFAARFRVITFDHRGFGNSSDPAGEGRSAYVADLLALLDHLHIERAHLLGQSMGGGTCISFTCQHPRRVASLVVADSLHALQEGPEVATIMDAARAATANLGQIERVLGRRVREEDPTAAVLYRQINSFNAVTRHNLAGAFVRHAPSALAYTGVPVLFIAGTDDVLFPIAAIRLVAAQVAGAQLVEIPDTGHSAFYESPAAFNRAVLNWME